MTSFCDQFLHLCLQKLLWNCCIQCYHWHNREIEFCTSSFDCEIKLNWLAVHAFALDQPRSQGSLLTFPTEPVSRLVGKRTWERSWPWPSFMNHPYTCLLASNCLSQHAVPGRTHLTFEKDGWILNSVIKEALEPPHKNGALYIHFKIQFLSTNIVRFHFAKTFKKGVDHKRGEKWPSEEV